MNWPNIIQGGQGSHAETFLFNSSSEYGAPIPVITWVQRSLRNEQKPTSLNMYQTRFPQKSTDRAEHQQTHKYKGVQHQPVIFYQKSITLPSHVLYMMKFSNLNTHSCYQTIVTFDHRNGKRKNTTAGWSATGPPHNRNAYAMRPSLFLFYIIFYFYFLISNGKRWIKRRIREENVKKKVKINLKWHIQ